MQLSVSKPFQYSGPYLAYSQALAFRVLHFLPQVVQIIRLAAAVITCLSTLCNLNVSFAGETDKYVYLAQQNVALWARYSLTSTEASKTSSLT
jgi:hypothetical protein